MGVFWGSSSLSFQDFILAAEKAKPQDILVLENGRLRKRLEHEENNKQLNRKTWAAALQALRHEVSEKKLQFICSRYGIDLHKMKHFPFPCQYVESFGIGAATAYTYELQEKLNGYFWNSKLSDQTVERIGLLEAEATKCGYLGKVEDPSKISGAPRAGHENFTLDYLKMDQQRTNLHRGIADLLSKDVNIPRMHPFYSRLAMGIVCLLETKEEEKDIGVVIPVPGSAGGIDYYKVYDIISYGGLNAIALTPVSKHSSLPPIVCFRCTKQSVAMTDGILSMSQNMEQHIGESGFKASEKHLERLVEDLEFTRGKKLTVLCYSLGGAHAGYFMEKHWRKVQEFVGFNFVGNDAKIIDSLAEQINRSPAQYIPPSIYVHRNVCNEKGNKGDWVNKVGQKHVGCGIRHPNCLMQVVEWIIDDYPGPTNEVNFGQIGPWMEIHGIRPMDEPEEVTGSKFYPKYQYESRVYRGSTLCSQKLDTYNRDPQIENLRLQFGYGILLHLVKKIYSFIDFIFRVFGIKFFRKNIQ